VGKKLSAYHECMGDCTTSAGERIGFIEPFESLTEAVSIRPTVSLALTSRAGGPRVADLGQGDNGGKRICVLECDSDCTAITGRAPS
jgi:hypothetical protein